MKLKNIKGKKFGRLTVISRAENTAQGQAKWLCRCSCGKKAMVFGSALRNGHTQSCGCFRREVNIKRSTIHGHATNGVSPTYHTWNGMISRCTNPKNKNFYLYGKRGITVCDRWFTFSNFLADMGVKPKRKSLDRINNNGNYCKKNCRWATFKEQANNKRKSMQS
jgi:hypothetical protein